MNRSGPALLLAALLAACAGTGAGTESRRPASTDLPLLAQDSVQTTMPQNTPTTETRSDLPTTTVTTLEWSSLSIDDDVVVEQPAPTALQIEAIGVMAPVIPLGVVAETGEMEVPANIDEVGWYRFGPSPGQPGSSVLAAHVDAYGEGPGIFYNLDRLLPGDTINVQFEGGETTTFVVTSSERVPKGGLAVESIFAQDGAPVLRLITCGGGFNYTSRSYDDNVVVTAQPEAP